jgi:hypothetical protein
MKSLAASFAASSVAVVERSSLVSADDLGVPAHPHSATVPKRSGKVSAIRANGDGAILKSRILVVCDQRGGHIAKLQRRERFVPAAHWPTGAQRTCLISYEGLVQMISPLDMLVRLYDML